MDRQLIRSLIDALAASDLSEIEYTQGDRTLRLVRGAAAGGAPPAAAPLQPAPMTAPVAAPVAGTAADPAAAPAPGPAAPAEEATLVVAAPSYGVVHLTRDPGAPPLAVPGRAVAAGDVLCLVEAMKVFTPLHAPAAGTVEAVLVTGGAEVEAGQPLVRIRR